MNAWNGVRTHVPRRHAVVVHVILIMDKRVLLFTAKEVLIHQSISAAVNGYPMGTTAFSFFMAPFLHLSRRTLNYVRPFY